MTIYMVHKDINGKYDVLYFKPEQKLCAYLGNQDDWWKDDRYINQTVEVKRISDLDRMSMFLHTQGYKREIFRKEK